MRAEWTRYAYLTNSAKLLRNSGLESVSVGDLVQRLADEKTPIGKYRSADKSIIQLAQFTSLIAHITDSSATSQPITWHRIVFSSCLVDTFDITIAILSTLHRKRSLRPTTWLIRVNERSRDVAAYSRKLIVTHRIKTIGSFSLLLSAPGIRSLQDYLTRVRTHKKRSCPIFTTFLRFPYVCLCVHVRALSYYSHKVSVWEVVGIQGEHTVLFK